MSKTLQSTEITRDFTELLRQRLEESLNFIQVVVGPRQVGKTTGVTQIFDSWNGEKVMASADLPSPPTSEWILEHWNRAREKPGEVLLVLDEIQKIPRWSETIKALFDKDRKTRWLKIVLLGSASLALSTGLQETLAGRFERIYAPHWDYQECKKAFSWDLENYLMFGGYPAPAEFSNNISRWQQFLRDAIIEPVLSRDIFGLANIRKPALFRQTLELAMHYPAQVISYQKLVGQLQDQGNLETIRHYLEILEQAFLLRLLPKFTKTVITEKRSSPKILPLCPALLHSFTNPMHICEDLSWRGRVLELVVGATLVQRYQEVFYWKEKHAELDFVVRDNKHLYAVEVKSGRARKQSGLHRFLKQFPDAIPKTIDRENILVFLDEKNLQTV